MRSLLLLLPAITLLAADARIPVRKKLDRKEQQNAQLLLTVTARYATEGAGSLGVRGLDDKISIPAVDLGETLPPRCRRRSQNTS